MIRSFAHKGLERFFATGSRNGIRADHSARLRLVLGLLDAAQSPTDMRLPGLRLHRLKGQRSEIWSVSVSASWRVTFRFDEEGAYDVDYEDYH